MSFYDQISKAYLPDPSYQYTQEEKEYLRPIAETLAMLDGNAFFDINVEGYEHYEQYLPEAYAIFNSNGGLSGAAGKADFVRKILSKYRTERYLNIIKYYFHQLREVLMFSVISIITLFLVVNVCSWVLTESFPIYL